MCGLTCVKDYIVVAEGGASVYGLTAVQTTVYGTSDKENKCVRTDGLGVDVFWFNQFPAIEKPG